MTYTYRCPDCGREHDLPGSKNTPAPEVVSCPYCAHHNCRRVWAAPLVVLWNGDGWTGAGSKRRAR